MNPGGRALAWALAGLLVPTAFSGCLGGGSSTGNDVAPPPKTAPTQAGPFAPPTGPIGSRPHVHDYWQGADAITLLQKPVPVMLVHNHQFDEPPRPQHTHGCDETLTSTSQGGSVKFSIDQPKTVIPGTKELSITFKWSDPTITGLRLKYRPAGVHDYRTGILVQSGREIVIPVAATETDDGHATRSQWGFFLCADDQGGPAHLAQGNVDATIVARRAAELPLEPPHRDVWKNATSLKLAETLWGGEALTVLNKGQEDAFQRVPISPGAIVPAGTRRIVVDAWLNSTSPTAVADPGAVTFYYRDSTIADWAYKRLDASAGEKPGQSVFIIPVTDDMADSVYSEQSNWDFWARISSKTYTTAPAGAGTWGAPHYFVGDLHVVVRAEQGDL